MSRLAIKWLWATVLLAMGLATPQAGLAQSGGVQITFNSSNCSSSNYPEVQCTLAVVDGNGVPVRGVGVNQFDVTTDNNLAVGELRVTERVQSAQIANVVIVLDFGAIAPGLDAEGLKNAAKTVLASLSENDQVALIGITSQIELGDTVNPPINPKSEIGFVQAGSRQNEVINLITSLQPQGNTPIYDAVCKALILAGRQKVGTRAVIVISDGLDRRSRTCVTDQAQITRAKADKTPVYAIGVGQNVTEDYLRSVTFQTGGKYFGKAADVTAIDTGFRDMLNILKSQYEVRFKSPVPADNLDHTVKVGINLANGREDATARYRAIPPVVPEIKRVLFMLNDRDVTPRELPESGKIVIFPELVARQVARVEYELGGELKIAEKQPFIVEFDPGKLSKNSDIKLVVRVVGDENDPRSIVTREENLFVKAAPVSSPTATPQPLPTSAPLTFWEQARKQASQPVFWVLPVLLVLGLLSLLFFWISRRRRSKAQIVVNDLSPTGVFSLENTALTGIMNPSGPPTAILSNITQVFPNAAKTMIYRPVKAVLEFGDAEVDGRRFDLGGSSSERVQIGREVNGDCDIRIDSVFVSRQHAEIQLQDDKLMLTDLGSASGTKLNGVRVDPKTAVEIKVGDQIEFANIKTELKMP